jgi:outer membrane lipoprotein-sorting protein
MNKKLFIILLIINVNFLAPTVYAQNNAFSYIDKYHKKIENIKNYSANFTIKSTINILKIPVTKGNVFYKWPAHYVVSTNGFTILPEYKLTPIGNLLIKNNFNIEEVENEEVENHNCVVLKLLPLDKYTKVNNYKVWIDTSTYQIIRVLITHTDSATLDYHYYYTDTSSILPSSLIYSFEYLNKSPLPLQLNSFAEDNEFRSPLKVKGKLDITFQYTDYLK